MKTDSYYAAFPRTGNDECASQTGISTRAYFAAIAMQGLLASCTGDEYPHPKMIASKSIEIADELIKQLIETPNPQKY